MCAGLRMASTSSPAARTTLSRYGQWRNPTWWRDARAISRGSHQSPSTRGGATTATTGSAAWAKTAGCVCGISMSACFAGPRPSVLTKIPQEGGFVGSTLTSLCAQASVRQRGPVSSKAHPNYSTRLRADSTASGEGNEEKTSIAHPVMPRAQSPMVPPVLVRF